MKADEIESKVSKHTPKFKDFNLAPLYMFDQDWAVLTAGVENAFNAMTISWAGLGTLWNKPVATVYVKPIRYTYSFLEKNEYFTISLFNEKHKKDLQILGSLSGKDVDKVSMTNLTPKVLGNAVTFNEAKLTIVCKKIYFQDLDISNCMSDGVVERFYKTETPHRMYVGEVVDIIDKR